MAAHHHWTEDENVWIKENFVTPASELTERFNAFFKTDVTINAMRLHCSDYLNFSFGMAGQRYTEAEDAWIKKHHLEMPLKNLYEGWREKFPSHDASFYGFKSHCQNTLRLRLDDPLHFHGWNVPKREIGDEHSRSGYTLVKVEHRAGHRNEHKDRTNWQFKHRVMWEKYHGRKLDDSEQVVFLNGDRNDYSEENLYAVPVKWMPTLCNNGWLTGKREVALAGIKYCELYYALQEKKGKR